MYAITGYQNKFRVRGVFPTRKNCQKYLDDIMTEEEKKYLTVKICNDKELQSLLKKAQVTI